MARSMGPDKSGTKPPIRPAVDRRLPARRPPEYLSSVGEASGYARQSAVAPVSDDAPRALRALVEAIVPETPALAGERGEEHRPGGVAAGVDEDLAEAFGEDATGVAVALEVAAVELLLRRRREDPLRLRAGGISPFASLSGADRRRALRLLEDEGIVPWLDDLLGRHTTVFDDLRELGHVLPVLIVFTYYGGVAESDPPLAWDQTGYPGPAEGYPGPYDYEVERFEEDGY